jgi:hypothetical protein
MAVKSQISKIVSSQIGPLQGKLRSTIQKKVLELLKEFANGCPNVERMKKIMKIRNNLLNTINSFQKRVDAIKPLANKIQPAISVAKIALNIITSIPTPTAIIPPQSGGLGVPMSVLNKYSKAIGILAATIDVLEADVKAVNSIVTTVTVPINTLRDRLQAIDLKIAECSTNTGTAADKETLLTTAQPPENTGSEGTPDPSYLYKGYTLAIIEDPNSPKIAPRRYAIAKSKNGSIVLKGPVSFSSSTQVLLDEIKFRIDNQLV